MENTCILILQEPLQGLDLLFHQRMEDDMAHSSTHSPFKPCHLILLKTKFLKAMFFYSWNDMSCCNIQHHGCCFLQVNISSLQLYFWTWDQYLPPWIVTYLNVFLCWTISRLSKVVSTTFLNNFVLSPHAHIWTHLDHPCSKPPQPFNVLMQANYIGSSWALSQ